MSVDRDLVEAVAEHMNGDVVETEHWWTIYPRDCKTCGGVGSERRIRELEAARDQQTAEIKRLRAQLHGRRP